VTLAATLAIVPDIPIQSLAILLGIDNLMSECRALTNLIGNGVATIVIGRWEGELDKRRCTRPWPARSTSARSWSGCQFDPVGQ
jgi:Na+/H+-dicarboxylate symporter